MRSLFFFFSLVLVAIDPFLQAQTPGQTQQVQQSTQIAVQAAEQATQISVQAAHRANEQMMRDSQQASATATQQASTLHCRDCVTRTPRFSIKSGTYPVPLTVTITADRNAAIYYTLDGWTPTLESEKYTGPIKIHSTATLQAIAVSSRGRLSRVAIADYKLPNSEPASVFPGLPPVEIPNTASSGHWIIPKDTAVPLSFASAVTSRTARIGDQLALALAEDITSDGVVLLHKGTPSVATITAIDRPKPMGVPAEIFFQANYIQADGTTIKLRGSAAKQGLDQERKAAALTLGIPGGLFVRGKDAEIEPGMLFTAYVDHDTPLTH